VVDQQPMTDETRTSWRQFLCRHVAPEDSPLFTFSRQSPDVKRTSHFAIISRATLLLRLTSGATAKLFRDAGINGQSIEFWWQRLGQGRGLWEGTKEVDDLVDLWADIEAMLASVDAFQGRNDLAKQTFFLAGNELQQAFVGLGSCERVAIWSSMI
jgi:transposase-like protein